MTAMALDDRTTDGEAETIPVGLRREEGINLSRLVSR
jgi:hypothetical protein